MGTSVRSGTAKVWLTQVAALAGITVLYALASELAKQRFYRQG